MHAPTLYLFWSSWSRLTTFSIIANTSLLTTCSSIFYFRYYRDRSTATFITRNAKPPSPHQRVTKGNDIIIYVLYTDAAHTSLLTSSRFYYTVFNLPISIILYVLYTDAAHTSLLTSSCFYYTVFN
jgi:hypothetical protein